MARDAASRLSVEINVPFDVDKHRVNNDSTGSRPLRFYHTLCWIFLVARIRNTRAQRLVSGFRNSEPVVLDLVVTKRNKRVILVERLISELFVLFAFSFSFFILFTASQTRNSRLVVSSFEDDREKIEPAKQRQTNFEEIYDSLWWLFHQAGFSCKRGIITHVNNISKLIDNNR